MTVALGPRATLVLGRVGAERHGRGALNKWTPSFWVASEPEGSRETRERSEPEWVRHKRPRERGGLAWMFPGQGSQRAGMGRALAERYASAARAFEEANDALGFDLRRLCFEGPDDELQRTANAQPALLATSIAALRAAEEALGTLAPPACVAGHSLGEFTALVAADALAFGDALRLVRRRGELMQAADQSGGMAAVLGLGADAIARAIEGTGCVVANDNAPGQIVVAGPRDALTEATARLTAAGAKRVIPLRVSAAFHSPAMRPVADALAREMARIPFRDAGIPVICNVDGQSRTRAAEFPELLARQVYSPVRWVAVIRRMREGEGATRFVEFGAGNVLAGLVKRIVPDAATASVQDPATLEEAAAVLRGGSREDRPQGGPSGFRR